MDSDHSFDYNPNKYQPDIYKYRANADENNMGKPYGFMFFQIPVDKPDSIAYNMPYK